VSCVPLQSAYSRKAEHSVVLPNPALLEFESMDLLRKLFEEHFHSPPDHVLPLQGELGGSGRKIVRLANEKSSAIGILYGVREENLAFLSFSKHFRKHGLLRS